MIEIMSEEAILLDNSLKSSKFLARYSGLTFESKKRKLKDKIRDRSLYFLNFFWLNTDVLGGIYWFLDGLAKEQNLVGLTYIAPCIILSCMANFKGYLFLRHEDKVSELIDELKEFEIKLYPGRKSNEAKIWKDETNFLSVAIKISNVLNVMLLLSFAVSPLLFIAYKYFKTNEVELILPFLVVYPFDWHDIRFWPFVYLHQIWSECIVVLLTCASDYLFWICCTYISILFKLVQNRLECIVDRNTSSEQVQSDLAQVIMLHEQTIRLVDKLESVYTMPTLYNFVSSSILICLTGFNVMAIEDVAFVGIFIVFLFSSLTQIFVLCLFGDMLMHSSVEVADAVYKSKWYNSKAIAKNLLLVQIRAQKPCKLTAAGFADVNLRAFTKVLLWVQLLYMNLPRAPNGIVTPLTGLSQILSSAWSYFALLNTMYSSGDT